MEQPFLMLGCEHAGLLCINGRVVGEMDARQRLCVPVAPRGRIAILFLPMVDGLLPVTCAITLAEGRLIADSVTRAIYTVQWPGGAIDIDIVPQRLYGAARILRDRTHPDLALTLTNDELLVESLTQSCTLTLPDVDRLPRVHAQSGRIVLSGRNTRDAEYLFVLSPDLKQVLLSVVGREARMMPDGMVRVLEDLNDTVGHAYLKTYMPANEGYRASEPEIVWADGGPRWPDAPDDTCIAAIEAYRLGRIDEALSFFTPGTRQDMLARVPEDAHCVRLRYPMPGHESAVGLMRAENARVACVEPLPYTAHRFSGLQGAWRLDDIGVSPMAQRKENSSD